MNLKVLIDFEIFNVTKRNTKVFDENIKTLKK